MCSFTCLQKYVKVSSLLTLIGSGTGLGFVIAKMVNDGEFFTDNSFEFQKDSIYMLLGACIVLFLAAALGVYGSCKGIHKCALTIYGIINMVLMAIFLGFGFFYVFQFSQVSGELSDSQTCVFDQGSDLYFLTQANNATVDAGSVFCSPICPCYVEPKLVNTVVVNNITNFTTTNTNAAQSIQQCSGYSNLNIGSATSNLMSLIEQTFSCSGICQGYSHFIFSNINNGVPQYTNGCKQEIVDFMNQFGSYLMAISFVIGFFLFINFFAIFALLCHQENQNKNVYELMVDAV